VTTLKVWELRDKLADMPDEADVLVVDDTSGTEYECAMLSWDAQSNSVAIMFNSE